MSRFGHQTGEAQSSLEQLPCPPRSSPPHAKKAPCRVAGLVWALGLKDGLNAHPTEPGVKREKFLNRSLHRHLQFHHKVCTVCRRQEELAPRKLEEGTSERSLDGRIGVRRAQGTEKGSGVQGPARAKASGRKPALSAFLLGEVQTLLTQSVK